MRTSTASSLDLFFVTIFVLGTVISVCNGGGHGAGESKKNGGYHGAGLKMNFYHKTCPKVEEIGCDASLLLDPKSKEADKVEKEARPNLSLLEKDCPETVSCADIVALAARDAVSFQYNRDIWKVQTGRRDGRVSLESEATDNLPSASSNFTTLQQLFARKGLNVIDLVALSGAHTIGIARCGVISRRLFNFTGKGDTDPSLDPSYANILKSQCSNTGNIVEMDPKSSISFDSHYFKNLNQHKGLFQSDASLLTNFFSARLVKKLQNGNKFFAMFGKSIKKMGAMEVLTGNDGEIRKQCSVINP
ncbi:Plant peroxidase [Macleaya cordata]|uniref:Peroxidase n=1 Tax=Macleaya cordata TaxID=56857 RepID=A0A200QLV9_MACCD|nr:Plant peroxidase [Macleaya cordata]